MVYLYICLLIVFVSPAKRSEPRDADWRVDLCEAMAPCIRRGRDLSGGMGNFGTCLPTSKGIGSQCYGDLCNNRDYGRLTACPPVSCYIVPP